MNEKKDSTHWTQEDYDAHLVKLAKALQGAEGLLEFTKRMCPPKAAFRRRMPFGLISEVVQPQNVGNLVFVPDIPIKPKFMVLSDETAYHFNIRGFVVGCNVQTGSGMPLPLESFAVHYYAKALDSSVTNLEKLLQIQAWGIDIVTPGQRVTMFIENTAKWPMPFRGILWADCSLNF